MDQCLCPSWHQHAPLMHGQQAGAQVRGRSLQQSLGHDRTQEFSDAYGSRLGAARLFQIDQSGTHQPTSVIT
eukprot:8919289-Karenia_brevis.AAC.1